MEVKSESGEKSGMPETPIIENIHQKVFEAASCDKALNMSTWHTCEITHCRAGWVVTLAGEAGKKLEQETSPLFAAMQIYHKSSPIKVSPVRFFDSDKAALTDLERCANDEKAYDQGK